MRNVAGSSWPSWSSPGARSGAASQKPAAYAGHVPYDEDLAHRIRALVGTERGVSEKKMFGGLAFLVGGNLAIAASGQGGILVRVGAERSDELAATTAATVAVMRGRPMAGWLRVDGDRLSTKAQLAAWVDRGVGYARTLPAKR